jgi:hypothetical protein
MAIKKCKECGEEVSSKAETCPHCGAPVKQRNKIGCLGLLVILAAIGFGAALLAPNLTTTDKLSKTSTAIHKKTETTARSPSQPKVKTPQHKASGERIAEYAIIPYTEKTYPKLVAKYKSRLQEIEKYRRKAAEMALDSGKCDCVEVVELSDSKSTLNHLVFWVDCRNHERIYLNEDQIDKGSRVLTQTEKSWTEKEAVAACRAAIKARSLIPNMVDFHEILGTSFQKAPTTGNAIVKMDFEASNALGVKIPYTAICHFEPGEVGQIDIKPRK